MKNDMVVGYVIEGNSPNYKSEVDTSISQGMVFLSKEFTFEASHVLPLHPGKCSRLHGHSWKLCVTIGGYVDPVNGFVLDYGTLKDVVQRHLIDRVDHFHLGYGPMTHGVDIWLPALGSHVYPTSENLIKVFANILEPLFRDAGYAWQDIHLAQLTLNETCTSACTWRSQRGTA